jgi:hypothetical protein
MSRYVILVSFIFSCLIVRGQKQVEQFTEPFSKSFPFRKEQHIEIKTYIETMLKEQTEGFMNKFEPDVFSIENYKNSLYPYRQQLGRSIGYPPAKSVDGKISRFEKVGEDKYSTVYRAWIEVVQGVHAYGIYMVPKNLIKKTPLIVAIHGGGGNPEAICGLDTRANYHAFGYEAVKRGYIVWAPGLAMFSDYSGDTVVPGAAREILDKQLKLFGGSIIGLEIHKIVESTKTLIKDRVEIDSSNVGMTGLSWGGFFTMYTTALCPFIKAAAISGNVRETKNDLNNTLNSKFINTLTEPFKGFGYFQVMGMICPRPCFVQLGEKDGIFDMKNARIETDRTRIYYEKLGIKNLCEFKEHPGGHEFEINSIFDFFGRYLK